ncbi:MAG: LptA/OstA family protein [Acetobacteraceae bacterium]
MHVRLALISVTLGVVWLGCGHEVSAQFAAVHGTSQDPLRKDQPVAFTADSFQYDRDAGIVTASGHVEAWQGDHVLRADKVTFDRNTNVAAASGNVVLVEPDGQVLFADYAELTQGMREGVLRGMRSLLAENGKLAANGARRVEGKVNELTHAVYTTCNLCKSDPTKPPLWQLRAYSAVQDLEKPSHRIRRCDPGHVRLAGRLPALPVACRPVGAASQRLSGAVIRQCEPYRHVS